jgi:hypothetical protein
MEQVKEHLLRFSHKLRIQKAKRVLVPMREATVDALLFTLLAVVCLLYTSILSPLLIVLIYALTYLVAMILRLRKAAYDTTAASSQERSLGRTAQSQSSIKTLTAVMSQWGRN